MINERGVATLRRSHLSCVIGLVYKVSASCIYSLDKAEGVSLGRYGKFMVTVDTLKTRKSYHCLTYIDPSQYEGAPRAGYLEKILEGAYHHNFPKGYIRQLETWEHKI